MSTCKDVCQTSTSTHYLAPTAVLTRSNLKDVLRAAYPAREKWWWIGLELGIEDSELDGIKGSDEECLRRMISAWLQRRSLSPSWQSLANALRDKMVGHEDVADDIEKTFVTVQGEESTAPGKVLVEGKCVSPYMLVTRDPLG